MHQFRGKQGTPYDRVWRIELSVRAVRKIWDVLKVDLNTSAAVERFATETRYLFLAELLSVLLEEQFSKAFPDETGHFDLCGNRADELIAPGEVFDAAYEAMAGEWADFSRLRGQKWNAERLDRYPRIIAKQIRIDELTLPSKMDEIESELQKAIAEATPGTSSTNTPEDSELPTSAE